MAEVRKAELSFLYTAHHLVLFYISIRYHQNILKGIRVIVQTRIHSNKTKGENSKSKKARVVILVRDMSSGPVLHFYQVSFIKIFKRV